MHWILRIVAACLLLGAAGCNRSSKPPPMSGAAVAGAIDHKALSDVIGPALAGAHRTEAERARDRYRHPFETLEFFGLRPNLRVVEVWPGGGWYTAVLAPLLREEGQLFVATMDPQDTTFRGRFARELRGRLAKTPSVYDGVTTTVMFKDQLRIIPPGFSVDLVVSFRSAHNWIRWEGHSPEAYFAAIAKVLKPGGIFGIVQHRAPEGTPNADSGTIGYLTEALVIRYAMQAGLKLIDRSEINANPRDTHDHPNGVWSLPPTLRGGDVDRDKYLAIGESDRMTLKFQKPAPP